MMFRAMYKLPLSWIEKKNATHCARYRTSISPLLSDVPSAPCLLITDVRRSDAGLPCTCCISLARSTGPQRRALTSTAVIKLVTAGHTHLWINNTTAQLRNTVT